MNPPTSTKRNASTHRVTRVFPALRLLSQSQLSRGEFTCAWLLALAPLMFAERATNGPHGLPDNLNVTTSRKLIRSVAVSYGHSSLLSAQATKDTVSVRLAELNPDAPDSLQASHAPQALWNALFWFIIANPNNLHAATTGNGLTPSRLLDSERFVVTKTGNEMLLVELPLPDVVLSRALVALGAVHQAPYYALSRAALFQLFQYATSGSVPPPFPYIPSPLPVLHPLRPAKPQGTVYSRYLPHLEAYFKLQALTTLHIPLLHGWLNNERVDQFWTEKGDLEQHTSFVNERLEDAHTLAVLGSYVPVGSEGEMGEEEHATYTEVS